jgi:hypothetical protein
LLFVAGLIIFIVTLYDFFVFKWGVRHFNTMKIWLKSTESSTDVHRLPVPNVLLPVALEGVDSYMEQIPITSQKESYDIKLQTAHH